MQTIQTATRVMRLHQMARQTYQATRTLQVAHRTAGHVRQATTICAAKVATAEVATPLQMGEDNATIGFVDTHCHMDMILDKLGEECFVNWRTALPEAEAFEACITIGCSTDTFAATEGFLACDGVYGAFGIHPLDAAGWSPEIRQEIVRLQELPKVVAVGECGLDYHYDKEEEKHALQKEVFVAQMQMAAELKKPLIVHTREAEEDTLALMREHLPRDTPVHVHCFTSSKGMAAALLADFPQLCIGFTGVVTFKNAAAVREVVELVPLDRILLETDGPYMAPVPHRGKPAHPGHIPHIASMIAKVKGVEVQEVLAAARRNTKRVYGF